MLDHAKRVQFLEEMGAPADALAMAHMVSWHHTRQKRALAGESYLRFCKTVQVPTGPVKQGDYDSVLPEIRDMLELDRRLPDPLRIAPLPLHPLYAESWRHEGPVDPPDSPDTSPPSQDLPICCDPLPYAQTDPLASVKQTTWVLEALTPWITSCLSFAEALEIADDPCRWGEATPQMEIHHVQCLPSNGSLWRARMTKCTDFGKPLESSLYVFETIDITADGFTDEERGSGFRRYSYVLRSVDPHKSTIDLVKESGWVELSGDCCGTQLRIHKHAEIVAPPDDGVRAIMSAALSAEVWLWATGFFVAAGQEICPPVPKNRPPLPKTYQAKPGLSSARVAIFGGGPAGLACAWLLSNPVSSLKVPAWTPGASRTPEFAIDVDLYERTSLLGGKAASKRGDGKKPGRIEEHGLHVLMGCYANLRRMLTWVDPGTEAALVGTSALKVPIDTPPRPAHTWPLDFESWLKVHGKPPIDAAELLLELLIQFLKIWDISLIVQRTHMLERADSRPETLDRFRVSELPLTLQMVFYMVKLQPASNQPRLMTRGLLAMARCVARRDPAEGAVKDSSDFLGVSLHWAAQLAMGAELKKGWLSAPEVHRDERMMDLLGSLGQLLGKHGDSEADRDDNSPFEQLGALARLMRSIGRTALRTDKGTDEDRFAAELVELGTTIIAGLDDLGFFPAWAVADPAKLGGPEYTDWVLNLHGMDDRTLADWLQHYGIAKGFVGRSRLLDAVTAALFTKPDQISAGTFIHGFCRLVLTYGDFPSYRLKGGTGEAVIQPLVDAIVGTNKVTFYRETMAHALVRSNAGHVDAVTLKPTCRDSTSPPTSHLTSPPTSPPTDEALADYFVLAMPPFGRTVCNLPEQLDKKLQTIEHCATIGLQNWTEGAPRFPNSILSGLSGPLRSACAMDQLQGEEGDDYPHVPVYYCGAVSDGEVPTWTKDYAKSWLDAHARQFQSGTRLHDPYLSVNAQCSERYVLSTPRTQAARPYGYDTGVDNLLLAGDWTHTALNCGSIEAAVTSGLEAARNILESLGCTVNFDISGSLLYGPNPPTSPDQS